MVLTLCHDCLQPFIDDKNYIVKLAKRIPYEQLEPHDNECDICVQPFFDDHNYTVKIVHPDCPTREKEKHDGECFICGRRGCDYDVEKLKK